MEVRGGAMDDADNANITSLAGRLTQGVSRPVGKSHRSQCAWAIQLHLDRDQEEDGEDWPHMGDLHLRSDQLGSG